MKLDEMIAGYVDLAEQAVAYRKATESREEMQSEPWKVLAHSSNESEGIMAYIAESDPSVTSACAGRVGVSLFSGKISLPYEPEKMEGLEDALVSARKKMLEIVLIKMLELHRSESVDAEGGEA